MYPLDPEVKKEDGIEGVVVERAVRVFWVVNRPTRIGLSTAGYEAEHIMWHKPRKCKLPQRGGRGMFIRARYFPKFQRSCLGVWEKYDVLRDKDNAGIRLGTSINILRICPVRQKYGHEG